MEYTEHYNFKMPQTTDPVRVDDFNENTQEIDDILATMEISQDTAEDILGTDDVPDDFTHDDIISALAGRDLKMEIHSGYYEYGNKTFQFDLSFPPKFMIVCGDRINCLGLFHNGAGYGTYHIAGSSAFQAAITCDGLNVSIFIYDNEVKDEMSSETKFGFFG